MNLLLVEDDDAVRAAAARALMASGYTVTIAVDGAEAIRYLDAGRFDIVITDLVMPEVEGLEVVKHARRTQPRARIVAISGQTEVYLKMAKHLGADAVLAKPFSHAELALAVAGEPAP